MNHKFLLLLLVCIISAFHCVPKLLGTTIIGGFMDQRHSFKYQVSLHKVNLRSSGYEYFCGGTMHEKYILTDAHCFMVKEHGIVARSINLAQERPKIIAGTNKRVESGIERDIVTISIPNTYQTMPNPYGDVAVVQGDSGAGLIFEDRIVRVFSYVPENCNSNTVPMAFTWLSLFTNQVDRAMNERAEHSDMHVLREHSVAYMSPDSDYEYEISSESESDEEERPDKKKKKRSHFTKYIKKLYKMYKSHKLKKAAKANGNVAD